MRPSQLYRIQAIRHLRSERGVEQTVEEVADDARQRSTCNCLGLSATINIMLEVEQDLANELQPKPRRHP